MELSLIYLESNGEAVKNMERSIAIGHKICFVDDLVTLHDYMYLQDGYDDYDLLIMDAALHMNNVLTEDLEEIIEEFKDFQPTLIGECMPIIGIDYFMKVINTRKETAKMVAEGRVVIISGHYNEIIKNQIFMDVKPNTVNLFDRSDPDLSAKFAEVFENVKKVRGAL
ncbi:MAG: hypothetical protein FWF81_10155 [Defluviitaleaceae bacterium]|nr:hypothetical protein [Defluviitaleaceae bacterium]